MAITGTGTQDNPYIPTTWEDLLSCTNSDYIYIELPASGGTFDMRDYYPDGRISDIPFKGYINGNNWTIKNAKVICEKSNEPNWGFVLSGNGRGHITNFNFVDCDIDANENYSDHGGNGTAALIQEAGWNSIPNILNCRFSGTLHSNMNGSYPVVIRNGSYNSIIQDCSFNIICTGNCAVNAGWNWRSELLRCNIKVTTTDKENNPSFFGGFNRCYIQGDCADFYAFTSSGVESRNSILNADVSYRVNYNYRLPNLFLVNTDKYSGSLPSGFIGVTTNQLKDRDHLNYIGFTISEDPINTDDWHIDPSINNGIPYIPSMMSLLPDPGEQEEFANCYIGEEKIKGMYIGDEEVKALYIGEEKI